MKGIFSSFVITMAVTFLTGCNTTKQANTEHASIVGKNWRLIELNGVTVEAAEQLRKEPHMILSASENKLNGNGGCNSFFGSYTLDGGNGISFSKIGATKMACPTDIMQVEHQLFRVFEMTNKFTLANDSLILIGTDMAPLAKFIASDMK